MATNSSTGAPFQVSLMLKYEISIDVRQSGSVRASSVFHAIRKSSGCVQCPKIRPKMPRTCSSLKTAKPAFTKKLGEGHSLAPGRISRKGDDDGVSDGTASPKLGIREAKAGGRRSYLARKTLVVVSTDGRTEAISSIRNFSPCGSLLFPSRPTWERGTRICLRSRASRTAAAAAESPRGDERGRRARRPSQFYDRRLRDGEAKCAPSEPCPQDLSNDLHAIKSQRRVCSAIS